VTPRIGITGIVRQWDGASRTGVNAAYVESVVRAGGIPIVLSPLIGTAHAAAAIDGVDGLLFTGGEDVDPSLYEYDRNREAHVIDLVDFDQRARKVR
jgi:gamma-glutamyl-gamma-aminobutyrate hydrolase PuuD